MLVKAQKEGRSGLAAMFTGIEESSLPADMVDTEGRFYTTLLNGLMVQWLFDPDSATTADQLTEGLRRVIAGVGAGADPRGSPTGWARGPGVSSRSRPDDDHLR